MVDIPGCRERLLPIAASYAKTGELKLASGKKSDFYFDAKGFSLHPFVAMHLGQILSSWMHEDDVVGLAGVEIGGCSLVAAAAAMHGTIEYGDYPSDVVDFENRKFFYVRKKEKEHGLGGRLVGEVPKSKHSLTAIAEDVITTGGSAMDTLKYLKDVVGLNVSRVYCVMDREEGGEELRNAVIVRSVLTKSDVVKWMKANCKVDEVGGWA